MNVLLVATGVRGGSELEALGAALAARGAHVSQAPTQSLAVQSVETERPEVVIALVDQAEGQGLALFRDLRAQRPEILTVAYAPADAVRAAGAAVHVAERVVTHGTTVDALLRMLEDAAMVRSIMGDDRMDELLHAGGDLPTPPAVAFEVSQLASDGDLDGVSRALERDAVLTGRVLQAANAPFFGIPRQIVSAREAALYLGLEQVAALVLGEAITQTASVGLPAKVVEVVSTRGLAGAAVVSSLANAIDIPKWLTSVAFTSVMLRDIGSLVMYRAKMAQRGGPLQIDQLIRERHLPDDPDGPTVAAVGAYLLSSWQIPDLVVAAVAAHEQRPAVHPNDLVGPSELTWVASACADRGQSVLEDEADRQALASLGLEDAVKRLHPSLG